MKKFEYTEKCGEISGFGGGYERICQTMVIAGMKWFEVNQGANPRVRQYKGVTGLSIPENKSMEELERVMLEASNNDCTGAMMQVCTNHVLYAKKHGWNKYIKEMEKPPKKSTK